MLKFHKEKNSEITLATIEVPWEETLNNPMVVLKSTVI